MKPKWSKLYRVGNFRILFTLEGSKKAVSWYGVSIGIESSWLRAWKKKLKETKNV